MDHCELKASLRYSVQTCLKKDKKEKTQLPSKFTNVLNQPALHLKGKVALKSTMYTQLQRQPCFLQTVTLAVH